ncbi:hypothetical protein ACWEGE_21125 [Amycolatopsis sp. NPDC004747]
MDVPEIVLCEQCRHPISPEDGHVVRQVRDEAHPLLAVLHSYSHADGDPACRAARPSRVRVERETRAFPPVVDAPPEDKPPDG